MEMLNLCGQSHIWGKYIKEMGWWEKCGKGKGEILWTISNMGKVHKKMGWQGRGGKGKAVS